MMFSSCSYSGYKYLNLPKEILSTIKSWLINLGLMYFEGHPVVPVGVTENEIEILILTLCPKKMWHIRYETGEVVLWAWDKNHAQKLFINLPWGETRWERITKVKPVFL